jgi:hypothetical protein
MVHQTKVSQRSPGTKLQLASPMKIDTRGTVLSDAMHQMQPDEDESW